MKPKIKILVCGTTNSGKTSIAKLIHKTLVENGIVDVEVWDDKEFDPDMVEYSNKDISKTIPALIKKEIQVNIETVPVFTEHFYDDGPYNGLAEKDQSI